MVLHNKTMRQSARGRPLYLGIGLTLKPGLSSAVAHISNTFVRRDTGLSLRTVCSPGMLDAKRMDC